MRRSATLYRLRRRRAMPINSPTPPLELTRESLLLGGQVRLVQPQVGYRAGMDAALLAAGICGGSGARLLEAGCGPGAALLQAAHRLPLASFWGVERDPAALALAHQNIGLNDLDGRVCALGADIEKPFRELGLEPFDGVFANPPYFDDPSGLRGPHPARRGAWLADGGLKAWTTFLLAAVRPKGEITVIHRADRLLDLLTPSQGRGRILPRASGPTVLQPAGQARDRAGDKGRASPDDPAPRRS